jgi:hypothetical protein
MTVPADSSGKPLRIAGCTHRSPSLFGTKSANPVSLQRESANFRSLALAAIEAVAERETRPLIAVWGLAATWGRSEQEVDEWMPTRQQPLVAKLDGLRDMRRNRCRRAMNRLTNAQVTRGRCTFFLRPR